MRALTLIQPMSWAIVHGTKRVERPRPLPKWMQGQRVLVAVHAGQKWDDLYANTIRRIMGVDTVIPYQRNAAVVGAMVLSGVQYQHHEKVPEAQRPWFAGPYGYAIEWAAPLLEPIVERGLQGFWRCSEEIAEACTILALDHGVDPDSWIEEPPQ